MKKAISKIFLAMGAMVCTMAANAQWTTTGTVIRPVTLTNNVSIGTTVNGANLYVEKSTAVTLGIKSTTAGATMFMDKGSSAANAAFAYKLGGVTQWNSGMLGNNNYSIRNVPASTFPLIIDLATDNVLLNSTGIPGVAPATYPLTVKTGATTALGLDNGASIFVKNSGGSYEPFLWPQWTDNKTYMNYGAAGFDIRNSSGTTTMYMTADNKVGIAMQTPHAALQFDQSIVNRKIVLWENANNDHQYYGFGINGGTLRYQVDAVGANHIFYAGTSATTSIELARITGSGLVGINQVAPSRHLEVRHNTGFNVDGFRLLNDFSSVNYWDQYVYTGFEQLAFSSNGVERTFINGTTGAVTQASDERLKNNVKPADNMLDNLMKLEVKNYTYIKNNPNNRYSTGIMAQQLNKYFPEFVYAIDRTKDGGNADGSDNTLSVDYAGLSVVAIKGLQELNQKLSAENETLKNRIDAMESCVSNLCNNDRLAISANTIFLEQNTPNPFNQNTTIRFNSGDAANAQIIIRDLSGNLIKSLNAAGRTQVTINANELAQGTYTYTLEINGKSVDTKLMVVTK